MNLRQFIKQHYKTVDRCADDLGVTRRTVENYCFRNPSGILKHSGQIIQLEGVEPLQLFDAVAASMEQINENRNRNDPATPEQTTDTGGKSK